MSTLFTVVTTRDTLLEVAERVFEEWGYRRTSMEDVAREAGLSRAGLYKHFRTKEALFRAVLEHVHEETLDRAEAAAGERAGAPLAERLSAVFDARQGALVDRVRDRLHGQELSDVAARVGGDLYTASAKRFLGIVARILSEAAERGEIDLKAAAVSPRAAAELMARAVDGLKAPGAQPLPAEAFRDRLPALIRMLVHGLGRHASSERQPTQRGEP